MDIRLKAIRRTAGQLAVMTIGVILFVALFSAIPAEDAAKVILIAGLSYASWILYKLNLHTMTLDEEAEQKKTELRN